MPLQVVCPNPQCRKPTMVKDELVGQALRCPACNATLSGVSRNDSPEPSKPEKDPATIQSISSAKESTSVARPTRQSSSSESSDWGVPTMKTTTARPARLSAPLESAGKASRGGQPEELPASIGHYQVNRELGRGAFGVVYKGHDPKLKRDVAIKVLNRDALHSTMAVERFRREAQVVAQLHHNQIVPVYELGEHEDSHYIASRFVPGKTLADLIPDEGMGAIEAVGLVLQLLEALTYAHKMNVLHRDVKPANAIVDPKGQLYLMDFGLAGWVGQTDGRATQDGAVMGTPAYMPPEQARGDIHQVRETADQYSAAVVLYELLTGHVPFEGASMVVLLHNVISTPPPQPSEFRADLDPQLEEICLKALAKTPEERYPSCHAFADALRTWKTVRGSPIPIAVAAIIEPGPKAGAEAQAAFIKRGAKGASPEPAPDILVGEPEAKAQRSFAAAKECVKRKAARTQASPAAAWETMTESTITSPEPRKSGATSKRRLLAEEPKSRKQWLIGVGVAGGVLMLGLVVVLAGFVIKVKTPHGTIIVANVPKDAEVHVEGETVTLTRNGEAVTVTAVSEGPHRLKVVQGGQEIWSSDVTVTLGGDPLRLKVEPRSPNTPPKMQPAAALEPKEGDFVPLFNCKDLTGWEPFADHISWRFEKEELIGRSTRPWGSLDTKKNDYVNFHLRMQTMLTDGDGAGLSFRLGPPPPSGGGGASYIATIGNIAKGRNPGGINQTGTLYIGHGKPGPPTILAVAKNVPLNAGDWFSFEVIANSNRIRILVKEQTVVDYTDQKHTFTRGKLRLLNRGGTTELRLRNIEIKELPMR
jgi:serine/threonine protein kinase